VNVDQLPGEIQPGRDLWAGIEAEIRGQERESAPRRRPPWRTGLAVAAAFLLGVGLSGWLRPVVVAPPSEVAQEGSLELAWEDEMVQTHAELLARIEAEKDRMDPEALAVIRENLEIIDRALERVRQAIEADPGNEDLLADLAFIYRRKLVLLRHASEMAG